MWQAGMLLLLGRLLHLVLSIDCPNADPCHHTHNDHFVCSHKEAQCVDRHCICNKGDYNLCTCLPNAEGCSIEQSAKAVAIPSYEDTIQLTYSCIPNFLNKNYNVHILSNHEGNGNSQYQIHSPGITNVYIEVSDQDFRPIVLILTSKEPVRWILSVSPRTAIIDEVILISDYFSLSTVEHDGQISSITREQSTDQIPYGFGDDAGGGNTVGLLYWVRLNYGSVASFTGSYKADRWDIKINGTEINEIPAAFFTPVQVCGNFNRGRSRNVRLAGRKHSSIYEGRVEVYCQGAWGTVCDNQWDILDATVVCEQLGYGQAVRPAYGAEFGEGSGMIILNNVDCEGDEKNLFDCKLNIRQPGEANCEHSNDAGVVCYGESANGPMEITQYIIRLAGSNKENEGRVEVLFRGAWGTVCDDEWDIIDARVVCRQLGYSDAIRHTVGAEFGQGTGVIVLDNVACTGEETNLYECPLQPRVPFGRNNCKHAEDAGVVCLVDSTFSLKFLIGPVTFFLIVSLLCLAICCLCKVCRNTLQRRRRAAAGQSVQYTNGNEYQLYVGDDPNRGTPIGDVVDLPPSYDSVLRNSAAYPRTADSMHSSFSPVPSTPPPSYSGRNRVKVLSHLILMKLQMYDVARMCNHLIKLATAVRFLEAWVVVGLLKPAG
ncbi:uncharacterized protein [Amphiura filiformis]|uniref:uncharacterized protein n=1 Tax=Amphiura filiformis TaxID=82378 RepID=UPI003B228A8E